MPRLVLFGFCAVFGLSFSCQRFKDRFDTVASLCGLDPASMQADERYVKLESPKGEELSADTLLTTRSRFLSSAQTSENLPISPRGCVRLPTKSGVLQAFSSARGWSVAEAMDAGQDLAFQRLPLNDSPRISAELQCPAQGFFAHKELPFPLRWVSDGALQAARFELSAVDEGQQKIFPLFEKPYGIHLTELPEEIRTETLPEGQYQLRLTFQISTEGWDLPGPVPTRTESCPLTVLHRRPEVGGLDGYALDQRVAVFPKGETIPWKSPSPESEVLFCRETRGQDMDEGTVPATDGVCQPQNHCQDLKNFKRGGPIIADEPGVFDYYAFSEDKAANRSALRCQTLVITEKEPDLKLLWSEADWNKPSAQMLTPAANVQLRIVGQHPQLKDDSLATRYQCKVDFVREDRSILSGRPVICTSGRCRNQSMDEYRSCDADLGLSLVDLWPNMTAAGGLLRVFVRADDRAGHVVEKMATIGIQPQRWKPTRWSEGTTIEQSASQMLQDRKGRIFTVEGYQRLRQWDENSKTWVRWPNPEGIESGIIKNAWFTQDDDLYVEWNTLQSGQTINTIYRWANDDWQALPSFDLKNRPQCTRQKIFHRGGFFCATPEGLALYEANAWTMIPFTDPALGENCSPASKTVNLVRDTANTLWLQCGSSLFQKAEGQSTWNRVDQAWPLVTLAADAQGGIWTLSGTGRDDLSLQMTRDNQSITLPKPPSFTWIDLRPDDFVIGPASEIILGDAYWDRERKSWQVFPYFLARHPGLRVNARFVGRNELIWIHDQGVMQWDGERLLNWDLGVHSIRFSTIIQAAVDQDGDPWITASSGGSYEFAYQFHSKTSKKWVYFPKPKVVTTSAIAGLWVDEQSTPRIYIQKDGLYSLDSGGWTRSLRSPGLGGEIPVETKGFEPILLSSDGIFAWSPMNEWTRIVRFTETRSYWGGTRDSLGRIWVYDDDSMNLGVIDGTSFSTVPLDPDAGTWVKGIFARGQELVVATEVGLFSRAEGQTEWSKTSWQDWGFETVDRIRQIDRDTFFVSVMEDSNITGLWLLDFKTGTKQQFEVPPSAFSLGNIARTSAGDYIIAINFDIYRTDGKTYTTLFSRKDLYSLPEEPNGTFLQINRMQLDAQDRVWFDIGYGVVRIDLQ